MNSEDVFLVEKAKKDPRQYEELYKKYALKIFNYFWYRTGHNRSLSEDLMQETFVRAFEHLPLFRNRGYSYYSYLLKIAHNVLVDHYRTPEPIPIEEAGDIPIEIIRDIERKNEAELLWKAIQTLSASERDILLMFYEKELSIKDIARIMGKTENAVKLLLSRTRKKLSNHPYLKDIANFGQIQKEYTKPKFLF